MKSLHIFKVILFLLLPCFVLAQYPNNPVKQRLGYQTTGDGLVYRGAGAPAYSPGTLVNAWMYLDTVNFIQYAYINFQWQRLPLVNNGLNADGAYHQLGGDLVENTDIEKNDYVFRLGKISGTNKAYLNIYGTNPYYMGAYTTNGTEEADFSIGNGSFFYEIDDTDNTHHLTSSKTGFVFDYLGDYGAHIFSMDSGRFILRTLPTYATHAAATSALQTYQLYQITDGRQVYSNTGNSTNVSPNIYDNDTYVGILNSKPFKLGQWTTAGRPTGVTGYEGYNTSGNGKEWYNGSRWAYALESTFARGTATRVPFFDANGQITDDAGITYSATGSLNLSGSSVVQDYGLDITSSITTNSSGSVGGVNIRPTLTYSSGSNPAAYGINVNPTFSGTFGGGYAGIVIQAKSQYAGFGSAGLRINTSSSNGIFIQGTSGRALIELSPSNSTTPSVAVLAASDNNFLGFTVQRNTTTVGVKTGMSLASIPSGVALSQVSVQLAAELAVNNGTASYQDFLINTVRGSSSTEQLRIKGQSGFIGLGNNPNYKLDATSTDAYGLPRGTVAQRPTIVASTTPFRYDTDSTALEYGESVGTWRLLATRAYARTMKDGNGIISALPAGNVSITTNTNTLTLNGSSLTLQNQGGFNAIRVKGSTSFEGTMIYGQRSFQYFTQLDDRVAFFPGHYNWKQAFTWTPYNSGNPVEVDVFGLDTVNSVARRVIGNYFGNIPYTHQFIVNTNVSAHTTGLEIFKTNTHTTGVILSVKSTTPAFEHKFNADGTIEFDEYGVNTKTASALSKTGTNWNATFATDGTVLEIERKRDTTIFVTADTDYDWSAAISTANISSRFNRVIIHLTLTSGAADYNTVTLHTPDANLMQCEYIIRGTDNSGSYSNEINFGTNNAISSDGTDASGYTLSAGQGLHVRVVYNGSSYKYIYY